MPQLGSISTLPWTPLMGGHSLDRISVQFQNFSGHVPHNSSLRHELNLPPSCTTLPFLQPRHRQKLSYAWRAGEQRMWHVFLLPWCVTPLLSRWGWGGTGRERSSPVRAYGRDAVSPPVGCPCFFNWLLVSFPLWQCVQMPVFEGSFCWFLRGTSASEELTALRPLLPTHWAKTLLALAQLAPCKASHAPDV